MKKMKLVLFITVFLGLGSVAQTDPFAGKYPGQVVLVDFWASWCTPCLVSFPWMKEMEQKYKDKGLKIITVNVDQNKKIADTFIKRFHLNLEVMYDFEKVKYNQMSIEAMPTSFLYNKKGNLVSTNRGFDSKKAKSVEEKIVLLLNETHSQ